MFGLAWRRAIAGCLLILVVAVSAVQCSGGASGGTERPYHPASGGGSDWDGPPNFVVILVDDLGYGDVGFNGAEEIETPNIDRIAAEGVNFSNGYVTASICTPSRAGLLTGRYPARFGLDVNLAYAPYDLRLGLPVEEATMADYLRGAGYRTGLVGKWQLGAAYPFIPRERGFDYFFGFLGGGHDYWGRNYDAAPPVREYYTPLMENRDPYLSQDGDYLTDVLGDKAAEFIGESAGEPFFLYLAYNAPHHPLQAPADLVDKYSVVADPQRQRYLAMVDSLDLNVGKVLDALAAAGARDNTVVFFLSDNGGIAKGADRYADNGPLRGGKDSLFDGGLRVPFAASWPAGWPAGAVYDPMVISLDIFATLLALAGIDPGGLAMPADGVNLDPFLRGGTAAGAVPHEALFWRHGGDEYAVRAGDLKLVKHFDELPQLYNLKDDIGERRNLLGEQRDDAARLAALWNEWNGPNAGPVFTPTATYESEMAKLLTERDDAARAIGESFKAPVSLAPDLPPGLRAAGGDGSIRLTWEAPPGEGITGYQLRYRTAAVPRWTAWRDVGGPEPAAREYTVRGLENGTFYLVQVRAVNYFGAGYSAQASATPQGS